MPRGAVDLAARPTRRTGLIVAVAAATCAVTMPSLVRAEPPAHLVISEIATGGASASDEFVELLNPTAVALPIANLELVYVTASGATVSRRVAWPSDAPPVPPGGHVLLANEAGVHAPTADATYAGGIADAGGTLVLRGLGGGPSVDAVGWGTATGAFLESRPAAAPPAGASLERRTAPDGSVQDTDDNAADFAVVSLPSPTGAASGPVATGVPTPTPAPPQTTPAATETPSASAQATPSATSSASLPANVLTIAQARALPDGTRVSVQGVALTASDFHDGGGFVADESGGIAVIVTDGGFAAGSRVAVSGTVDDRFAQRTIRAVASDVLALGVGADPAPLRVATGAVAEADEGRLVRIVAAVRAAPTALSTGIAVEVDDGSGAARLVIATATGISATGWAPGTVVDVVGVVGQRDSSGTGSSGYRVQPRSPADVVGVTPPATPTPTPTPSASPSVSAAASASAAPSTTVLAIRDARAAAPGSRVAIRGTVTFPPGVLDAEMAVVQDETAAIVVRLESSGPALEVGDVVEVEGVRSTRSGMETVRATETARVVGRAAVTPAALAARDVAEAIEARLVVVRGTLPASARRASSGTVTFDVADGSGEVRVVLPSSLRADDSRLTRGAYVEVVGVVGQETTGAEPNAGYRIWPRSTADVRLRAAAEAPGENPSPRTVDRGGGAGAAAQGGRADGVAALESLGAVGAGNRPVGATLVTGSWPELGIAGLLWDGEALAAIAAESAPALSTVAGVRPPVALALAGVRPLGLEPRTGTRIVLLGSDPGDVAVGPQAPDAPRAELPATGAAWVALVGQLVEDGSGLAIVVAGELVEVEVLCESSARQPVGSQVVVTGIGLAAPQRLIVPCDGVRFAPSLARTAARVTATPSPGQTEVTPRASAAAPDRRALAAALLVLGTAAVGCGAIAWRRPALHDVDEEAAAGREAPSLGSDDDRDAPTSLPRPLTLVRLPRDRGP